MPCSCGDLSLGVLALLLAWGNYNQCLKPQSPRMIEEGLNGYLLFGGHTQPVWLWDLANTDISN